MVYKALTIAGSDSSGGAGIQADLKTMAAHKVYGMSVITALTAQNTTGVAGMVSNAAIILVIAAKLKEYAVDRLVVDPVMVATSGSRLMKDDAVDTLRRELLPLATVITPNIPEAEVLAGFSIADQADMERAAAKIAAGLGGAVLVKGGHLTDSADDLLWTEGRAVWFSSPRVDNPNTHGTGCTLSSAIVCNLAKGRSVEESVRRAKAYITGALKAGLDLGKGSGPLDHAWATPEIDFE